MFNCYRRESTNYEVTKSTNSETQIDAVLCHSIEQQCPNTCKLKMCDSNTQTENFVTIEHCYAMLGPKSKSVGIQHCSQFGVDIINTDSEARFYTGLAFPVFNSLVNTLSEFGENLPYRLPIPDQILLTLMRLSRGPFFQDLGTRFGISLQLCSNIFSTWNDIFHKHLQNFTLLPINNKKDYAYFILKQHVLSTAPKCSFNGLFHLKLDLKHTVATKVTTRQKYLLLFHRVAGYIMFISHSYGGRASDFITKSSGVLNVLRPGDKVMADRGFLRRGSLCP